MTEFGILGSTKFGRCLQNTGVKIMKISKDILDKLNFVQKNYFLAYCAFYKPSMRERERERERERHKH